MKRNHKAEEGKIPNLKKKERKKNGAISEVKETKKKLGTEKKFVDKETNTQKEIVMKKGACQGVPKGKKLPQKKVTA